LLSDLRHIQRRSIWKPEHRSAKEARPQIPEILTFFLISHAAALALADAIPLDRFAGMGTRGLVPSFSSHAD